MLNLAMVFNDALVAFENDKGFLATPPLPATIFLMQRDVINHYRHALTHYFDLTLDEAFLQNSSHGPPYAKWAKFTNEDFAMLSFAFHNLLRYTSRFIHETECASLARSERFSEMKSRSNSYTGPICSIKYQDMNVGIRIEDNQLLVKTALVSEQVPESRPFEISPTLREHRSLREYRYDISDRSVIAAIQAEGMSELAVLVDHNRAFSGLINRYYADNNVAVAFESMNESWWV